MTQQRCRILVLPTGRMAHRARRRLSRLPRLAVQRPRFLDRVRSRPAARGSRLRLLWLAALAWVCSLVFDMVHGLSASPIWRYAATDVTVIGLMCAALAVVPTVRARMSGGGSAARSSREQRIGWMVVVLFVIDLGCRLAGEWVATIPLGISVVGLFLIASIPLRGNAGHRLQAIFQRVCTRRPQLRVVRCPRRVPRTQSS